MAGVARHRHGGACPAMAALPGVCSSRNLPPLPMSPRASVLVLALAAAACKDPVDQAAKARIFSPEDPPQVLAAASETLRPEDVADSPTVARRILGMGAAEAVERLGAHTFVAQVSFEWSHGERVVKLSETRTLRSAAGALSGDFHGTLENSRDQGFDVLRVNGEVYARSRYGRYRRRLRDRGMAERAREDLHGLVAETDALFGGRMVLKPEGTATYEGRTAWKYTVSLGPKAEAAAGRALPPPPATKDGGVDEDTTLRRAFFNGREPYSLTGEVLVDSVKAVVLRARLDGTLTAPGQGEDAGTPATLRLKVDATVSGLGKAPALEVPKDALPDEDKPVGLAEAMDRFGLPRGRPDAGTPDAGAGAEEPPDETR